MSKNREMWVDVAKGFGFIFIVCIHSEFIFKYIPFTYFIVPLFFFMSGFYDRELSLRDSLGKYSVSLLLPSLIWAFVAGLFFLSVRFFVKKELVWEGLNWVNPFGAYNGPVWFTISLFYIKVFMGLVHSTSQWKYKILGIVGVFLSWFGLNYEMPLYFNMFMAVLIFYLLGKYLYKYIAVILQEKWLVAIGVIVLVFNSMGYCRFVVNPKDIHIYSGPFVIAIIACLLSFIPFLWLCRKITFTKIAKLGQHSLGIMLVHVPMCVVAYTLCNRMFGSNAVLYNLSCFICLIVIICCSYGVSMMIQRYFPVLLGKKR